MSDITAPTGPSIVTGVPAKEFGWTGLVAWPLLILVLAALPLVFRSGIALTMMSLMGITVIFALSYNMLLGQTGLLSFGHAVYYGLGAFITVHVMNAIIAAGIKIPLPLMPLVGGIGGLFFAILFGWVSTRRAGTTFAMISLGLAELVASSALILRTFFGGEEGVSTNRTKVGSLFGYSFGPQLEMYYLIAAWCVIAIAAMYWITLTPLGRMCNAVRDNPQRAEFVGYNPQLVRYLAFCLSGFFAGIAGALAAINFELANSSFVGLHQSGVVLLASYIGGVGHFIGPIIGAVVVSYLQTMLSDVTEVWQLYFGLMFIAVVMYLPGGLAGVVVSHWTLARAGVVSRLLPGYAVALPGALALAAGLIMMIELVAHASLKAREGPELKLFYTATSVASPWPWAIAIALIGFALLASRLTNPWVRARWSDTVGRAAERGLVIG
jgi:branched-chain amino acid transport system permease protein